jgi:hypothetical protein
MADDSAPTSFPPCDWLHPCSNCSTAWACLSLTIYQELNIFGSTWYCWHYCGTLQVCFFVFAIKRSLAIGISVNVLSIKGTRQLHGNQGCIAQWSNK